MAEAQKSVDRDSEGWAQVGEVTFPMTLLPFNTCHADHTEQEDSA